MPAPPSVPWPKATTASPFRLLARFGNCSLAAGSETRRACAARPPRTVLDAATEGQPVSHGTPTGVPRARGRPPPASRRCRAPTAKAAVAAATPSIMRANLTGRIYPRVAGSTRTFALVFADRENGRSDAAVQNASHAGHPWIPGIQGIREG